MKKLNLAMAAVMGALGLMGVGCDNPVGPSYHVFNSYDWYVYQFNRFDIQLKMLPDAPCRADSGVVADSSLKIKGTFLGCPKGETNPAYCYTFNFQTYDAFSLQNSDASYDAVYLDPKYFDLGITGAVWSDRLGKLIWLDDYKAAHRIASDLVEFNFRDVYQMDAYEIQLSSSLDRGKVGGRILDDYYYINCGDTLAYLPSNSSIKLDASAARQSANASLSAKAKVSASKASAPRAKAPSAKQ